jgi:hypothetical protein
MKTTLAITLLAAASATAFAGPKKEIAITQMKDLKWFPADEKAGDKGPMISVVFGDIKAKGKPIGFLLKVPAGGTPGPHTHTSDDYAVILQGTIHNFKAPGDDKGPGVTMGGTWFQPGGEPHDNLCEPTSKDGCISFVYMEKGFDFKPYTAKKDPPKKDEAKKP